ncbi:uncharacterized protein [Miscanthus floridulus]|uniref:uncharacterized protein isoform X1 n=1 Tax=Miscanthus floridulus TaxID=154761 RepID=UPI003458628D
MWQTSATGGGGPAGRHRHDDLIKNGARIKSGRRHPHTKRDAAEQKHATRSRRNMVTSMAAPSQMEKRVVMVETVLDVTKQYRAGLVKASQPSISSFTIAHIMDIPRLRWMLDCKLHKAQRFIGKPTEFSFFLCNHPRIKVKRLRHRW